MPERLSLATVAALAVLVAIVFGGAFALAHGGPAEPALAPSSPTAIRLEHDPIGELHRASRLPALIVPPPKPEPEPEPVVPEPVVTEPAPVVETPAPQAPAPVVTPAPAPEPTPAPTPGPAPAKKPLTFDDSG